MGICLSNAKDDDSTERQQFSLQASKKETVPKEPSKSGLSTWKRCEKREVHYQFTSIQNFKLDQLPKSFRSMDVYNLIFCAADLTARLRVNIISKDRPDGYVFSRYRGNHVTHMGTGTVFHVEINEDNTITCPCASCDNSVAKSIVYLRTAAHVIFDELEAKNTQADMFFDNENDTQNVKTVYGIRMNFVDLESDISEILCVSHDEDVADILKMTVEKFHKLNNKVVTPLSVIDLIPMSSDMPIFSELLSIYQEIETEYNLLFSQDDNCGKERIGSPDVSVPLTAHLKNHLAYSLLGVTDIVRSIKQKDNLEANGSEESVMENIEVTVMFPDGEVSLHKIWMFEFLVKENKEFLLQQGGINKISPNELVMIIECADKTEIILDDEEIMLCYIHHLTEAECLIKFELKDHW